MIRISACFLTVLGLAASLPSQSLWRPAHGDPEAASSPLTPVMAYDEARRRTVLFSPEYRATHEWDGERWHHVASSGPYAYGWTAITRTNVAMCFDKARRRTLLFNASDGTTWEWDGVMWTRVATTGPGVRPGCAMAYDAVRNRAVLHGGYDENGLVSLSTFDDTWEWDGSTWTQMAAIPNVLSRMNAGMTFDVSRGRVVLHGGQRRSTVWGSGLVSLTGTYEWDGTGWTSLGFGAAVGANSLTFDAARSKLIRSGWQSGNWSISEWDGAAWLTVDFVPSASEGFPTISCDSFSGTTLVHMNARTWSWDGATRTLLSAVPPNVTWSAVAHDTARGRTVLIGGFDLLSQVPFPELWEWDGERWYELGVSVNSSRFGHVCAYDPGRGKVVVYGGGQAGVSEWDGVAWTQPSPSGPAAAEAMAHDPIGGGVIVFGGGETWRWDGVTWTQVATTGPSARQHTAMATDLLRERVVLFGGEAAGAAFGDTWEWDGQAWTQVSSSGPFPRCKHAMAYDEVRGRVVMHGGDPGCQFVGFDSSAWDWDGTAWTRLGIGARPDRLAVDHAMTFDATRGRVVMVGPVGWPLIGGLSELQVQSFGTACPGSAGLPQLRLFDDRPAIGGRLESRLIRIPDGVVTIDLIGFELFTPGVPLTAIGMTGCELYLDPLILLPRMTTSGFVDASIAVPNDATLVGLRVLMQSLIPDSAANPFGLTTSNAVAAVISD